MNLAYCDLSGNNILVNENTDVNSVCMIDIDNIYIPGADEVNVLGTSRYLAPEILTRQLDPDIFTDSYSLAVILFELLKAGHPYIGDFIEDGTPEQMTEAYKGLYPYVEDPSNDLNRSSQMLPSDVVFTTQLKELFQKTFIDGKENRVARIRAQEYALAFQRASNLVVKCSNCGNWHYTRPDSNHKYICPWCDAPYEKPLRIAFYEKYNCKISGQKIPVSDKHLEDFILKEKSKNIVTKNYIKDSYEENDDTALEEYFSVRLAKDGKFYLINQSGNMLALKKANEEKFIVIKKDEMKPLEMKDTIIFDNPKDLQNFDFGNNVKGISFRYAVVR
jgi:serine/threonine protein kinase